MNENTIGEMAQRIAAQYDAIHMSYVKKLFMKHGIPYVENIEMIQNTLKQKGYELIYESSHLVHSDGKKHYSIKLCKVIDAEYYAIKNPELKIGDQNA